MIKSRQKSYYKETELVIEASSLQLIEQKLYLSYIKLFFNGVTDH